MRFFPIFRRHGSAMPQESASLEKALVSFDDETVSCRRNCLVKRLYWSDLRAVLIRKIIDLGPFVENDFVDVECWVLWTNDSDCVIPNHAEGMSQLLERLQTLPNFDNNAVNEAMQSTENRWFLCWKHPDACLRQRIRWNFFRTPWREVVWSLNQKTT